MEEEKFGEKFRNGETRAQQKRQRRPGNGELMSWVICKVILEVSLV